MITVEQLTKRFISGNKEVLAVDHLSFSVKSGEVYGLLGPNGAGKTTTQRMILGLLEPDEGYAEVDGFRTSQAPDEVKRRIGFVSADTGVYQWLTARETLMFFADVYGLNPEQAERQLGRISDVLSLQDLLDRRCANLSSGQRQRINLARALIHNPPVMLLDEPTRGLDIVGSHVIFEYIGLLRDRGKAVIVTTHRLDEAQRLCDFFGLLHEGRLVHEGTLSQLQRATGRETLTDMFLSTMGADLTSAMALAANGADS